MIQRCLLTIGSVIVPAICHGFHIGIPEQVVEGVLERDNVHIGQQDCISQLQEVAQYLELQP